MNSREFSTSKFSSALGMLGANSCYEWTREDDKMAPRLCAGGDFNRYHLRAPKNRRLESTIDAATVTGKIDFLRSIGLTQSTQSQGLTCQLCNKVECFCDINTGTVDLPRMKDQNERVSLSMKPCRVLIAGDQCKVCKKLFKCETDVQDHMKKRHNRLKVTLKLNNETVSTKWIKRSHLKRRHSHSDSHYEYREGDQVPQMSNFFDSSLEAQLEVSGSKIRRKYESKSSDSRPCSAPSLGVSFDLPLCRATSCHCCVRNNARSWDDNNNNCPKLNLSKSQDSVETSSAGIVEHESSSASVASSQVPKWLLKSTTSIRNMKKEVITLDDTEDINDITVIPTKPPCYDLTESSYHSDDEVEKVLEIRKNQAPFISIKGEPSDSMKGLSISDAIRDLMSAENSLSCHDQEDAGLQTPNFYENLNKMESDDEEENNFTLRFEDDEESCTFVIKDNVGNKEYAKGFSGDFFGDTQLDVAVSHHDALDQSSGFWRASKNVECFSAHETPIECIVNRDSMVAIKEELTMDHYLFDRE
ncbi:uncharacterized protein [Fopius arisanus]|uniref:Uncharacterized protein isoform X2 n=1 Tax=Fopius arisanus TaxID=64838 RepID=A0A9R1UC51_9HYME|nr:PREDICTED: uncharacterized protein LOC105274294 isoform X2 [Fopius arisanus]